MTTEPYVIEIYDSFRAIDFDTDINYGAQDVINVIKYVREQRKAMGYRLEQFDEDLLSLAHKQLRELLITPGKGLGLAAYYLSIIKYLDVTRGKG